jgi:hypothetical protein
MPLGGKSFLKQKVFLPLDSPIITQYALTNKPYLNCSNEVGSKGHLRINTDLLLPRTESSTASVEVEIKKEVFTHL